MSKIVGGILGRPSGKIGGIVFGSARSRTGKAVTARTKVSPSNPNSPAQQQQRGLFKRALDIVRGFGPDVYQVDFNRSIGQLAGFQSLMSVILNNVVNDDEFSPPPDLPLGNLHFPSSLTIVGGVGSGEINISFSEELGDNGTLADKVVVICYAVDEETAVQYSDDVGAHTRDDGSDSFSLTGLTAGADYVVGFYLIGQGTAEGLLTKCAFEEVTATA